VVPQKQTAKIWERINIYTVLTLELKSHVLNNDLIRTQVASVHSTFRKIHDLDRGPEINWGFLKQMVRNNIESDRRKKNLRPRDRKLLDSMYKNINKMRRRWRATSCEDN